MIDLNDKVEIINSFVEELEHKFDVLFSLITGSYANMGY